MAVVRIPTPLRKLTGGHAEVKGAGGTVRELLGELEGRYPGFREKILDEGGGIRRFINVFVNGEDVKSLRGLETETRPSDEVSIVPAIAGGSLTAPARWAGTAIWGTRKI